MKVLVASLSMVAALWPTNAPAEAQRPGRPNIIFIMTDDHAAHAIGAYGSRVNKTPQHRPPGPRRRAPDQCLRDQLDLHAEPRRDPDRPVLAPQRRDHVQSVRQLAHDGGAAAAAGRLLHRHDRQVAPRQRSGRLRPVGDPSGPGRVLDPVFYTATGEKTYTGRYATDVITDLALDFLEQRPRDKPFFLMMHHKAPHRPWEPDRRTRRALRRAADSRARHVLGRLRNAHGRAARKPAARRRRSHEPRSEADAAAGARPERPDASGSRSSRTR